ncbi:hypothetical protein P3T73_04910 [Kiritimatiellota bacterium B12222]|nr:hypothetical protein P3T73_04910 [Kiritimatiellota bacterium B12222]
MIVIMIIGLLAAISYPSYRKSRDKARRTVCINNLRIIQNSAERYLMENVGVTEIDLLDLTDYFSKNTGPTCPASGNYSITVIDDSSTVTCDFGDGHVN